MTALTLRERFDALPEKVAAAILEEHRDWNVHDDWWDFVYEDAATVAEHLGIDIRDSSNRPNINFTGFWSQGDGACFSGTYKHNPNAMADIKAYCTDPELIAFAEELTAMQVARQLQGSQLVRAETKSGSSRYSHSGTMETHVYIDDDELYAVGTELEEAVTRIMRGFADWIYKQLEQEHDHLTSDEAILDSLEANDQLEELINEAMEYEHA